MSVSPTERNIANRLTSSAVIGTISATSETPIRTPPVRRGRGAIAKPAHDANRTVSGTAIVTTMAEFKI